MNSKEYIEKLQLSAHPEGGFFKEVYRAEEQINDKLPSRYAGSRAFSTSIYFLLEGNQISSLHRLNSDEIWHFYDGSSIKIYIIDEDGKSFSVNLGNNLEEGETFQTVIKKNSWFGAEVVDKNSFSLVGCTVAPGFDFDDFELGSRDELLESYPQYEDIIKKLTKD